MLAADAQMDVGAGGAAQLAGHIHQLAHTDLIQPGERIALIDLVVVVGGQELAGIVTAEAEGHLSQVVGTEGEELRLGGDGISGQRSAGISIMVPTRYFMFIPAAANSSSAVLTTTSLTNFSSLTSPTRGDHDLRHHVPVGVLLLDVDGGADDGTGLHNGDLREGDGQTAAAVTHHGG